jgi:acetyltransferase EpsM
MGTFPKARLVIVGAGGHGRELRGYVHDIIRDGWDGELLGHLDDAPASQGGGMWVLGALSAFVTSPPEFFDGLRYVTAVGNNAMRRDVVARLEALYGGRFEPWTLVHSRSQVGDTVEIGDGTCLAPGSIVTAHARIGRHCILNIKASVSHDCTICDFVNINPGATICGNVSVGSGAYIGAGATIKDTVSIGAWSVIGAGAVVIDDIPAHATAVGVPARIVHLHGAPA